MTADLDPKAITIALLLWPFSLLGDDGCATVGYRPEFLRIALDEYLDEDRKTDLLIEIQERLQGHDFDYENKAMSGLFVRLINDAVLANKQKWEH